MQRSLEGLTRSLGKELKKGSNAQLVYVAEGADDQIESTLRFLLSPRSAYVSAQVIRIGQVVGTQQAPADWQQALAGKKVLVTGASRGIGAAIAEVMARDGAQVICLDVPQAQAGLDEVRQEDRRHLAGPGHWRTPGAAKVGGCGQGAGRLGCDRPQRRHHPRQDHCQHEARDLAVGGQRQPLHARAHQRGHGRVRCPQVGRPHRVCLVHLGHCRQHGQTNYAVSKAGVIGMVESTAPSFAKHGITINAVAPGFIETQMTAAIPFAIREAGRRMNSMSQGGLPVDVAEAIGWFASPASSGITGNVVRVCGQSLIGA